MPRFRAPAISALIALLIPATSAAVTISLVPDRPPTIAIGETVNVDVFMVLDAADQAVGIVSATFHLELGSAFVSGAASGAGSVFPTNNVGVRPSIDAIVFSQFGATVTSPQALLGTLALTGVNVGSYDLVARRFSDGDNDFPSFTAPPPGGTPFFDTRYDFTSDETVKVTVVPESSSWLLLSLGIAGVMMIRRKLASRA